MKISEFIHDLEVFKNEHGDVDVETEYWCQDCNDTHFGKGFDMELVTGKLRLSIDQLGG